MLIRALGRVSDLKLYGPGFVDAGVLAHGPEAFYEAEGPFAAVVTDEYPLQEMDPKRPLRFVNHACRFDRGLLATALDHRRFLTRVDCPRICTLIQSDYYNFQPAFLDRLQSHYDAMVVLGPELIPARESADETDDLSAVDRSILERWTDRYRAFALAQPERVISLPHLLAETEFSRRPFQRRRPWTVAGANYTHRVAAREALSTAGIARTGRSLPYLFAGFEKLRINPYAHYGTLAIVQRAFRASLRGARYAFTCGSIARLPIRKYFEMPAAGCVLVADPCEGFADLGFRDRENAVVARGRDVADVHRWLESLPDRGQSIAAAGQSLVREQHSVAARARQLAVALEAVVAGRFAGSRWQDGRFRVRHTDGSEVAV